METTEKIVNSYCNYILGLATIQNIKCEGQHEIDILAVDPKKRGKNSRYHIECSVSLSGYSKITAKPFSEEKRKQRVPAPGQRMTIGNFIERKFDNPQVLVRLGDYGFEEGKYRRVIVAMGWTDEAEERAKKAGIELWAFDDILHELAEALEGSKKYFDDDTLRTIQLFLKSQKKRTRMKL